MANEVTQVLHDQALKIGSRLYEQYMAAKKISPEAVMVALDISAFPSDVIDHTVANMSEYGWYLQQPGDGSATLLARRLTPDERDAYTASKLAADLADRFGSSQEFIQVSTKPTDNVIRHLGLALLKLNFLMTHIRKDELHRITGIAMRPHIETRPRPQLRVVN